MVAGIQSYALQSSIGNIPDILFEHPCRQTQNTVWQTILGVADLKLYSLIDQVVDVFLKCLGPNMGVLFFDSIDQVNTKVEVDRLIAQDVFKLLADTHHLF